GQKQLSTADANPGMAPYLANARAVMLKSDWAPGEPLDLSTAVDIGRTRTRVDEELRAEAYLASLTKSGIGHSDNGEVLDSDASTFVKRMKALAFFQQLDPPDVAKSRFSRDLN